MEEQGEASNATSGFPCYLHAGDCTKREAGKGGCKLILSSGLIAGLLSRGELFAFVVEVGSLGRVYARGAALGLEMALHLDQAHPKLPHAADTHPGRAVQTAVPQAMAAPLGMCRGLS